MAQINIPDDIYNSLKNRAKEKGYNNTEEYIISILKEIVSKLKSAEEKQVYSKEDEEAVKDRLRGLGYID